MKYHGCMSLPRPTELETTIADAASSEGKSLEERTAVFKGLLDFVDAVCGHLPPEERQRRGEIAEKLHARPDPWWKNVRKEEVERARCNHLSE